MKNLDKDRLCKVIEDLVNKNELSLIDVKKIGHSLKFIGAKFSSDKLNYVINIAAS